MTRARHVWVNCDTKEVAATDTTLGSDEIAAVPQDGIKIIKMRGVDFRKVLES
jgi:hypothetical protein